MIDKDGAAGRITDFESEDFGGYIQPTESIFLDLEFEELNNLPDKIPVVFEGPDRPQEGKVYIDSKKFRELNQEYEN